MSANVSYVLHFNETNRTIAVEVAPFADHLAREFVMYEAAEIRRNDGWTVKWVERWQREAS